MQKIGNIEFVLTAFSSLVPVPFATRFCSLHQESEMPETPEPTDTGAKLVQGQVIFCSLHLLKNMLVYNMSTIVRCSDFGSCGLVFRFAKYQEA